MTLWTIGHSTKPIDEFLALLTSHGITRVVDVRTVPRSRHNPQFEIDALTKHLTKTGFTYVPSPSLADCADREKTP
jgi:uncharacterized protein (DUF488 family)